jgi:hypothetical protein
MIRKLSSILIFNRKYIEFKKEGESLPFFVGCVEGRFEGRFALTRCFLFKRGGRWGASLGAEGAGAAKPRLEVLLWALCGALCFLFKRGDWFWILNFGLGSHWVVQFKRDLLFKRPIGTSSVCKVMAWRAVCYECFLRRNDCYAILAPIGLFNLNGIYCLNAEAAEALRLERRARGAAKPIR